MKKILSLLLVAVMAFGLLLPATVFASAAETVNVPENGLLPLGTVVHADDYINYSTVAGFNKSSFDFYKADGTYISRMFGGASSFTVPTLSDIQEWVVCFCTFSSGDLSMILVEKTEYNVWVGTTQITAANKDDVLGDADTGATVRFDPDTNTLTLDGCNYTSDTYYAVKTERPITVNLVGENSLTAGAVRSGDMGSKETYGILCFRELVPVTFAGSGSLTVRSADVTREMNGGSVVTAGISGAVIMESGNVTAVSGTSVSGDGARNYGVFGAVTMNGGRLTAIGGHAGAARDAGSYGICNNFYKDVMTVNEGILTAFSNGAEFVDYGFTQSTTYQFSEACRMVAGITIADSAEIFAGADEASAVAVTAVGNSAYLKVKAHTIHDLTAVAGVAATCTADGKKEAWICESCGAYFADADAKTEIGDAAAYAAWIEDAEGGKIASHGGHAMSEPTYTWSEDNTTCTAFTSCANCDHEITETVTARVSGNVTYVTFEDPAFETQLKELSGGEGETENGGVSAPVFVVCVIASAVVFAAAGFAGAYFFLKKKFVK